MRSRNKRGNHSSRPPQPCCHGARRTWQTVWSAAFSVHTLQLGLVIHLTLGTLTASGIDLNQLKRLYQSDHHLQYTKRSSTDYEIAETKKVNCRYTVGMYSMRNGNFTARDIFEQCTRALKQWPLTAPTPTRLFLLQAQVHHSDHTRANLNTCQPANTFDPTWHMP